LECRLYAENPQQGFLPASGEVLYYQEPNGAGVRVDSGICSGDTVSVYYDPLVAKIITSAEDRPAAIRRMQQALRDTILLGLINNREFLLSVLESDAFQHGRIYTRWIEEEFMPWQQDPANIDPLLLAGLAAAEHLDQGGRGRLQQPGESVTHPWQMGDSYRLGSGEMGETE
jgi:acetyl/propionyl-CoA carboxylase alpha subunit